ncbi:MULTISPECIES: hypothetical protein [Nannocystis]|uniref:Uncharacterized protein n=1 Tax=Nannocystis radixulma TaxID=2995305 RepID=A0ABT5BF88_9BACT|nr:MULTISPECIES: hypothetical protein [Nannocystis]MCY1062880.1 hypothetical protein [Nannocystis sp. SCPEA4]MDC0671692.1 hypothetical protein [Nannocystis radixulma]
MTEGPLSLTKVTASIGGALVAASFFLPLVDMRSGGSAAADVFGVESMRRHIERSRELESVKPLIEPALQQLDTFGAGPSLRNLSRLVGATKEIVDTVIATGVAPAEARTASSVLGTTRLGLWLVPLVGALQTVLPLLTRFRGYAGFFGLVARFGFGLVFVTLALIPLLGAPGARPFLGSAVYAALVGGGLMMAAGMGGVTRGNFVLVFAAQGGILAAVVFGLRALVEAAQRAL